MKKTDFIRQFNVDILVYMDKVESLFLRALSSAIRNVKIDISDELTNAEWRQFFHLATIHDVLPLIINSVYQCESLKPYEVLTQRMIRRGRIISINQAQKTADFALLYQQMNEEGLKPLVMKGIICRNLYETPELRPSTDEDLLIFPWQIEKYHDFLMNNGFVWSMRILILKRPMRSPIKMKTIIFIWKSINSCSLWMRKHTEI